MKNTFTKKLSFVLVAIALVATGCGDGFHSEVRADKSSSALDNDHDQNNDNNNNNGEPVNNDTNPGELPNVDGKVDGGIWSGKNVMAIDWTNMDLIVSLPLDIDVGIVGGSIAIPKYEDIYLEMVTTDNGSQQLQVRVPLERLVGSHDPLAEAGLPNGDPLPMVPGGKLPRIDANIGKQDVNFYLGRGTVAVFVPTKFNPFITLVFPIKNAEGEALGYFATIAKKGTHKGGFYASIQLPKDLLKQIGSMIPGSEF